MRPQKPYIDDYYFCVVKMEKGYTIAVGFVKKVHNRGFPLKDCHPKLALFIRGVIGENARKTHL